MVCSSSSFSLAPDSGGWTCIINHFHWRGPGEAYISSTDRSQGIASPSFRFRYNWKTFTGSLLTLVSKSAVTKEDIQNHFKEGPGTISEIKLMSGFGFIEYEDKADARDVVPGKQENTLLALCAIANLLKLTVGGTTNGLGTLHGTLILWKMDRSSTAIV